MALLSSSLLLFFSLFSLAPRDRTYALEDRVFSIVAAMIADRLFALLMELMELLEASTASAQLTLHLGVTRRTPEC